MAKVECRNGSVVEIPSESILQQRLVKIIAESKRLKLLIRTARDLERIQKESTQDSRNPREGRANG